MRWAISRTGDRLETNPAGQRSARGVNRGRQAALPGTSLVVEAECESISKKRVKLCLKIKAVKNAYLQGCGIAKQNIGRHSSSERLGNGKEHEIWAIREPKGKCKQSPIQPISA